MARSFAGLPGLNIIAAVSENGVIGRDGAVPWDLPEDRRLFRRITLGHPVILGRKTFESVGGPLDGRTTIVLSRDPDYRASGCLAAAGLDEALEAAFREGGEAFVCGGEEIYRLALPRADRILLTRVHLEVEGDAFFPRLPPGAFEEVSREEHPGPPPWTFLVLERQAG